MTILKFSGEVAGFYQRYRRGYPADVVDTLAAEFGLTAEDTALDLGCGTGQLTLPLAARTRAAIGMDPEPDMLAEARKAAAGVANVAWLVGADSDVPALEAVLGKEKLGVVTIGQALHWMDHETLFPALRPLLRPGGGVAVITNGAPMWLHDSPWSNALREYLAGWLGKPLVRTCGAEQEEQDRYRASLAAAGFTTGEKVVEYEDEITLEYLVGAVYSAMPEDLLPNPDERAGFEERLGVAVAPHAPFVEPVRVRLLTGGKG
ncbi:class I SAM-dependent methyltransferase [Amycolatopsis oliviviridis]|uniref:Methyltransferase n=1 Tax=Amycolatopsis oliviviridis TaxID=1471590 RepID=A0ABQ3LEZ4_9PSEU|nr:class I SAM-dependent methyltransferase [Amycolatopsis oliviviridis]GHH14274.1 methyltransferase [Amycolatopsis oliviviridis]